MELLDSSATSHGITGCGETQQHGEQLKEFSRQADEKVDSEKIGGS
jgi:hypothetical protein